MEIRDEMFSNVGAQDMDKSGYQVSDLDDFEFYWENDQLDLDAYFRPGIDIHFSPTLFDDLEMGGSAEHPKSALQIGGQGELSSKNNSLWETNTIPYIAEKSYIWEKNSKCSCLCL